MSEWIQAFALWCHRRRWAMHAGGADAQSLLALLPIRRTLRSAWLAPSTLVIAAAFALALNPLRRQVLVSAYHLLPFSGSVHVARLIPLTPRGTVPVRFAAVTLWIFLLAGFARLAPRLSSGGWRIGLYGAGLLCEMAAAGSIAWGTSLQLLLGHSWGAVGIQGFALLLFLMAYAWAAWWALRVWWRDLERRCPVCLRLPGLPDVRGKAHSLLIEPLEVESICFYGHGLAVESRWRSRFQPQ